jgi:hypothetical protein
MKGHVLALKLNTTDVVKQLPLATEAVPFRVIISPSYTEAQRKHALQQYVVRPQKLRQLLAWAKRHNPYFEDVQVDETVLASLPESSVPSTIVSTSADADDQSAAPKPASARAHRSSFDVHNRVLSGVEKERALEAATVAEASAAAAMLLPTDAMDDGDVHYNALLRVAAPVVDTGEFLREAAAAAPTYPTSPPRPAAPPAQSAAAASSAANTSFSSASAVDYMDVKGMPQRRTIPPSVASRASASSSASCAFASATSATTAASAMLAFPSADAPSAAVPASGSSGTRSVQRALYHVQPSTPVWENEKDWFERAFCLNLFPFGRGGPSEKRRTPVSRSES